MCVCVFVLIQLGEVRSGMVPSSPLLLLVDRVSLAPYSLYPSNEEIGRVGSLSPV